MPRSKTLGLPVLLLLLLVPGCSMDPVEYSPEEVIIANAYAVQRAVEVYASEHDGRLPSGGSDERTRFAHILPGGERLMNPYILRRTNPVAGYAIAPGQIGFWGTDDGDGYIINGVGKSGNLIVLSKNYPDTLAERELAIIANAQLVYVAAEAFAAENNGHYTGVAAQLVAFLPGGEQLVNPLTGARTEPVDGTAASRGQVGYEEIVTGGTNSGFTMTAYGHHLLIATCCGGDPDYCYYWTASHNSSVQQSH
jgi:hypothetical protein